MLSPKEVFQQNTDRQRIVVFGSGSAEAVKIITEVLKINGKKFSIVINGESNISTDSPIVIIKDDNATALADYQHHIMLLTGSVAAGIAPSLEATLNATPKGGIVVYPENDALLKAIGGKERPDVQAIPYKTIQHEEKNGNITLVTSTHERFPIQLKGKEMLELLSATKEVLKKIGISSGQFYRGVAGLQAL